MPKLSIIISAYNHQKFIAKCLNSILEQTFEDFEVLIFDDLSSDDTWNIIQSFKDPRIKAFRSEYNRGMVLNINEAIRLSKGEYIANINSDDYWHPNKLEKQIEFFDTNQQYGVVFTGSKIVNEKDQIIDSKNYPYFQNVSNKTPSQWLNHFLYQGNCLCFPSVMVRKICYEKVGLYNPAYVVLLDLEMWVRLSLENYKIHIIEEELTYFRVTEKELNLSRIASRFRSMVENAILFKVYLEIKNKDQFLEIFPDYSNQNNILDHNLKYHFLIMLIEQSSNLMNNKIKNKSEKRLLKRCLVLREIAIQELFNKMASDQGVIEILRNDFDFDFKKQLNYSSIKTIEQKNKEKRLCQMRVLACITLIYVAFSLIFITYTIFRQ